MPSSEELVLAGLSDDNYTQIKYTFLSVLKIALYSRSQNNDSITLHKNKETQCFQQFLKQELHLFEHELQGP